MMCVIVSFTQMCEGLQGIAKDYTNFDDKIEQYICTTNAKK
jgi:hypothetical protein